jgi:hypothetical protein
MKTGLVSILVSLTLVFPNLLSQANLNSEFSPCDFAQALKLF